MLVAEFVEDHCSALRIIAEEVNACLVFDGMNQVCRELRVRAERLLENRSGDLPMPGGRVFPRGFFPHSSPTGHRVFSASIEDISGDGLPKSEREEIRKR